MWFIDVFSYRPPPGNPMSQGWSGELDFPGGGWGGGLPTTPDTEWTGFCPAGFNNRDKQIELTRFNRANLRGSVGLTPPSYLADTH